MLNLYLYLYPYLCLHIRFYNPFPSRPLQWHFNCFIAASFSFLPLSPSRLAASCVVCHCRTLTLMSDALRHLRNCSYFLRCLSFGNEVNIVLGLYRFCCCWWQRLWGIFSAALVIFKLSVTFCRQPVTLINQIKNKHNTNAHAIF